MKSKIWVLTIALVLSALTGWASNKVSPGKIQPPQQRTEARIDVAFCLDTTGSMSGLIEGAKQKIWTIVNTVAAAKPKPVLRIALVAYRDQGDDYVTRVIPFTSDLEAMYTQLRAFSAGGGGDEPEHVNRALQEAVGQLQWSKTPGALKVLYLVGDAPPHLDYRDGYDYRKASRQAAGSGIIINTIQCGQTSSTGEIWKEIARLAEGKYAAIDQSGGMIAINSPYDRELTRLSSELNKTYVAYGDSGAAAQKAQETNDFAAASLGATTSAERAVSKSSGLYKNESWDLVDAVNTKTVALDKMKPADMPAELRGKPVAQQRAYLEEQGKKRSRLQQQIQTLSAKRDGYVAEESKKLGKKSKDAFDAQVLQTLQDQGKEKGIQFQK